MHKTCLQCKIFQNTCIFVAITFFDRLSLLDCIHKTVTYAKVAKHRIQNLAKRIFCSQTTGIKIMLGPHIYAPCPWGIDC